MPAAVCPFATFRPISYRAEAGAFTGTPRGWILHVVVGNGSPYGTFATAKSPDRRFSTFWVAKSGGIEQYTETGMKSWAQGTGNGMYWSIETEGYPSEALTDAQITSLARLHDWLGAPDRIATTVGDSGIGVHYMGGQAWGGHTCPDPSPGAGPRSKQRAVILARAVALRGGSTIDTGDDMTVNAPIRYHGAQDIPQDGRFHYLHINDAGHISTHGGPLQVAETCSVSLAGLPVGSVAQLRAYVVTTDASGAEQSVDYSGAITEIVGTAANSFGSASIRYPLKASQRLRWGLFAQDAPVTVAYVTIESETRS